ncbi:uncharacterized protein LOC127122859 [Lathyrus oleraceus]|uniref:uncharacterized protein LOC127122859 n=1 Tax=Pisum sativum TaxID=3888 RepID=UPI0021CFBA39|nr:uncharacterized protein LOC127122859 [Pisum sativum]
MTEALATAQNQPPPPPQTPHQRTLISEIVSTSISMAPISVPQHHMPPSFPWGMPPNFVPEGYQPEVPVAQPVMSVPPTVVHIVPYVKEPIFHADKARLLVFMRILHKFKVPYFEKYKDNYQLRAMSHKEKEIFKEYAQRWREIAAQVSPPLEEKEMTKLFLKMLSPFYYDRMVASAPSNFIEMVNMGLRLEKGVREGRLKEERHRRLSRNSQHHQHVASVTPVINFAPVVQATPGYQPHFQQRKNQHNQQNRAQRPIQFDQIPMTYTKLFTTLIQKNLVKTRTPPAVLKELPWWYKVDQHCAFHQGTPGYNIENCFALKAGVRRLIQSGILSFEDSNPNVQANPLPKHGNANVNMFEGYPRKYRVFFVNIIRRFLVEMHATLCELIYYEHDHASCQVCSDPRGCTVVKSDLQEILDKNHIQVAMDRNKYEHEVNTIVPRFNLPEPVVIAYDGQMTAISPLVIRLAGPTPYELDKVVPYKYNATMVEDDKEVHIPSFPSIVNIADVSGVTRSGRVFAAVAPKRIEDVVIEKSSSSKTTILQTGQSSIVNQNVDQDEVLELIKKSDFNVVDQLLHNPSKISMLSLLMSSEAHPEALKKVLEKAYVDHGMTIDQFNGIVANITACNNLSFSNEELPEHGSNHSLAVHISMNCQEDTLSNVLVDTESSLNVLPKSTLSKLAYQGAPMRFSGVVIKAFYGSRKTVIGEVELPIKIGP